MIKDVFYINYKDRSNFQAPDTKLEMNPDECLNSDDRLSDGNDQRNPRILSFTSMKNELTISKVSQDSLYHFIMCMTICNEFTIKSGEKAISVLADDKALVETSHHLGISLVNKTSKSCVVNIQGNFVEFPIIAYKNHTNESYKNRIIISDTRNMKIILYVRGIKEKMLPLYDLSPDEKQLIEDSLRTNNIY